MYKGKSILCLILARSGSKGIKDKTLYSYLKSYEGKKINLPVRKQYYPDKDLLKKHREITFKD